MIDHTLVSSYIPDKAYLSVRYYQRKGMIMNWQSPLKFTEKLQVLKIGDRSPLHTKLADKVLVKDYISSVLGSEYVIPVLHSSTNPLEFIESNVPEHPFVLKTNHDSGGVEVFQSTSSISFLEVQKYLKRKLRRNFYWGNREWEYKNIVPKWFIEPLIRDNSGNQVLNDYKIHCFHGKPHFIQTIFDRKEGVKENWFNTDWEPLNMWYFSKNKKKINKPQVLEEMLQIAKKLSNPFPYVRIDLYECNGKIYFGEVTFRPYGGFMKWNEEGWDYSLGKLIDLNDIEK